MKKRLVPLLLTLAMILSYLPLGVLAAGEATTGSTLYVSVDGNDETGDGSSGAPFATIQKARDRVRTLNDSMTGDITVIIGDGTYTIDNTIEFTAEDSASSGHRITYKAAPNAKPIISGGTPIIGWKIYDATKNIYKATVSAGMNFRELYVDGAPAIRSRSTKPGEYKRIVTTNPYNVKDSNPADGPHIVLNTSEVAGLNLPDAELFINNSWTGNMVRIDHIVQDDTARLSKVYLKQPESDIIFNRPHPWIGNYRTSGYVTHPYRLENAYDLIDLDTEWYLNTTENTVYFKAPTGMDMSVANVVAPKVETLLSVDGKSLDTPVVGLGFDGLTFMYSNWTVPSQRGLVDGQALQYMTSSTKANEIRVSRPAAAVQVACANNIRIENNTFQNLAAVALDFFYGTHDDVIKNNVIKQVGGNGIQIGKFTQDENTEYHTPYMPTDKREICTNEKVLNNTVSYIGQQYVGSVAIVAGYPKGITIANNTIHHVPYTAISVGYGWTPKENAMAENRIVRNNISVFCQITDDGGAIYTLSNQTPNSLMAENYIHDSKRSPWSEHAPYVIYTDEQTMGYTIVDNVLTRSVEKQDYYKKQPNNNYAGDLQDAVIETDPPAAAIAQKSGVQEYLKSTDNITPTVRSADLKGNVVTLGGIFLGDGTPDVIFTAKSGTVSGKEGVLEANGNYITCVVPETAVAGPVSVKFDGGAESNRDVILASGYVEGQALTDDFESYAPGVIASDNPVWLERGGTAIPSEIATVEGNKVVKLTSDGENGGVKTKTNFRTTKLIFDFYLVDPQISYEGLYIVAKTQDNLCITPTFKDNTIRYGRGTDYPGCKKTIDSQKWYTCQLAFANNQTLVKVWERGATEPAKWDVTINGAGADAESSINLEYFALTGSSKVAYLDNITVYANETPSLTLPTVTGINPSATATAVGKAPQLPQKATATLSDGTTVELPVYWDAVSPDQYAQKGEFTVNGTVTGATLKALCTVSVTDAVVLSPASGNITITANGYTQGSGAETAYTGDYVISGTSATNIVKVTGGTHTITLNNVTITSTADSPFQILGGNVTLMLEGNNTLETSKAGMPALQVNTGASLKIDAADNTPTLSASGNGSGGNGIGGISWLGNTAGTHAGQIEIAGGTVTAKGTTNTAKPHLSGVGIGGGYSQTCDGIKISGGVVNAIGGAVGIGTSAAVGMNIIELTGGTITATGHYAGIGCPELKWNGTLDTSLCCKNLTIENCSVNATTKAKMTVNTAGVNVYLVTLTAPEIVSKEVSIKVDGGTTFIGKADADGKLYLYLPAGAHTVSATFGGKTYAATGVTVTADGAATATLNEVPASQEKFALSFRVTNSKEKYYANDTITADIYLSHPTVAAIGSFNTTVTCDSSILTLQAITGVDVTVTGNSSNGKIALVSTNKTGFPISATGVKIATVEFLVSSPATPGPTKISFGSTSVADLSGGTFDPLNLDETSTEIQIASSGHKVSGTVSFNGAASFETTARLYLATDVTGTGKVDLNKAPVVSAEVAPDKTFVLLDVPDGTYTLVVSKKNHTDAFVFNVVVNGTDTTISKVMDLFAGDVNEDNKINSSDVILLMKAWGTQKAEVNLDEVLEINAMDIILLMTKYGYVVK